MDKMLGIASSGKTVQKFHAAVRQQDYNAVKSVLTDSTKSKKKRFIDSPGDDGLTALNVVCSIGSMDLAGLLIEHGANVNAMDKTGWTALLYAASNQNLHLCELLISAGADSTVTSNSKSTVLHTLARMRSVPNSAQYLRLLRALKDRGVPLDALNDNTESALLQAVFRDNRTCVQFLISSGANLNLQNKNGDTALHFAARANHVDVLTDLLNNGADPNIRSYFGTPADVAVYKCHPLILHALNKGYRVDEFDFSNKGYLKHLIAVLQNPRACLLFFRFLEASLCHENLAFFFYVERFKSITSPEELAERGAHIFTTFIENDSLYQVNIDEELRVPIETAFANKSFTSNIFNRAQDYAISLLCSSQYQPFLRSEIFGAFKEGLVPSIQRNPSTLYYELEDYICQYGAEIEKETIKRAVEANIEMAKEANNSSSSSPVSSNNRLSTSEARRSGVAKLTISKPPGTIIDAHTAAEATGSRMSFVAFVSSPPGSPRRGGAAAILNNELPWNRIVRSIQLNDPSCKVADLSFSSILICGGVDSLSEAIGHNQVCHKIILSNNHLDDASIITLAQGLKQNVCVRTLDLSFNDISDVGVDALIDLLRYNPLIERIHLQENSISVPKEAEMWNILLHNFLLHNSLAAAPPPLPSPPASSSSATPASEDALVEEEEEEEVVAVVQEESVEKGGRSVEGKNSIDVNDLQNLQRDLSELFATTEKLPQFSLGPKDIRVLERLSYSPIQYSCSMGGWNCLLEIESLSKQQQGSAFLQKMKIREKLSALVDLPQHPNVQQTFFYTVTSTEVCVFTGCYVTTLKQLLNRARTRKNSIASLLDYQSPPSPSQSSLSSSSSSSSSSVQKAHAFLPLKTIASISLGLLDALIFLQSHSISLNFISTDNIALERKEENNVGRTSLCQLFRNYFVEPPRERRSSSSKPFNPMAISPNRPTTVDDELRFSGGIKQNQNQDHYALFFALVLFELLTLQEPFDRNLGKMGHVKMAPPSISSEKDAFLRSSAGMGPLLDLYQHITSSTSTNNNSTNSNNNNNNSKEGPKDLPSNHVESGQVAGSKDLSAVCLLEHARGLVRDLAFA